MTTFSDGRYQPDTVESVVDAMMADAERAFDDELPEETVSVLRAFYRPHAIRLVELQRDLALVLDSAQIDHATDEQLDLLTALIGVPRLEATPATGEVEFSRATAATQDYLIPSGTEVSTTGNDPVVFETTEPRTLASGSTSVLAPVEAVDGGSGGNVAPDTITILREATVGVSSVTNPAATEDGTDREDDDSLRLRAKQKLTPGAKASAQALITQALAQDSVQSASIFINDTNLADGDGQPPHSFELVVDGPETQDDYDSLAQMLLDTKAAGDTSSAGIYGTEISGEAKLINGQTFTLSLSEAVSVPVYVDMELDVTTEYEGDTAVRNNIVRYIGGVLSSNSPADGRLEVGEDVIFGAIEYAIRQTPGVYDVSSLTVDTVDPPVGTANISIALNEKAVADATDGSLAITTTTVNP
mgnify:CR=1 FL=1